MDEFWGRVGRTFLIVIIEIMVIVLFIRFTID